MTYEQATVIKKFPINNDTIKKMKIDISSWYFWLKFVSSKNIQYLSCFNDY